MEIRRFQRTALGEGRRMPGRHGYVAYFPSPLPRELKLAPSTIDLLAEAEVALGRLGGVGALLPNPRLLSRTTILREAVSSTRIEGTRASLTDIYEGDAVGGDPSPDTAEVRAYADALEWGVARLRALPLSLRLLREVHQRVLASASGHECTPGALRRSQNWIGAPNSTLADARFVPPPPDELPALLADWERFAHESGPAIPLLVRNALLHYQFETIHPFLDGNGRVGRIAIVLALIERGRLSSPLIDISSHFERDRDSYYTALRRTSETGDATRWIDLFLRAVAAQSEAALARALGLLSLREDLRRRAAAISSPNAIALVDLICEAPVLTARLVRERLAVTRPTAGSLLRRFAADGLLRPAADGPRGQQRFVAREVLGVLADPRPSSPVDLGADRSSYG